MFLTFAGASGKRCHWVIFQGEVVKELLGVVHDGFELLMTNVIFNHQKASRRAVNYYFFAEYEVDDLPIFVKLNMVLTSVD